MRRSILALVALSSLPLLAAAAPQNAPAAPPAGTSPSNTPPATAPARPAPTPPAAAPTRPAPAMTPPANAPAPAAPSSAVPEQAFVIMETTKGPIVLELDGKLAPLSVENFLSYVEEGFYDGTIFHRVLDSSRSGIGVIQGGGFDKSGEQKVTRAPIKNEFGNGLKNGAGTISYARTRDPNSATTQFFINTTPNPSLDSGAGYAVFGKVVAGMDAVSAIQQVPTGQRTLKARSGEALHPMPAGDVPVEIVEIVSVRRVSAEDAKKRVAEIAAKAAPAPGAGAAPGGNATGGNAPGGNAPGGTTPGTGATPPARRPPAGGTPPPPAGGAR